MPYGPESVVKMSADLEMAETREKAKRQLAELMAEIAVFDDWTNQQETIENILAQVPAGRRQEFLDDMREISKQVGWAAAMEVLAGELNLDKQIRKEAGLEPEAKRTRHAIKRPEEIRDFLDFFDESGKVANNWIPRRFDIRRYVRVAELVHERANRNGPIRILDMGGAPGFLGKLIADEARQQGLEAEIVVVDPDKDANSQARAVYADTLNLSFDDGTAADAILKHGPELSAKNKKHFTALEKSRLENIENGREELQLISATANALEEHTDPADLLTGPFGEMAALIMAEAGIDPHHPGDVEEVRNAVAEHYRARRNVWRAKVNSMRDEQERLIAEAGAGTAKFDVVLNSWMPSGIDFTPEIRLLAAPAIIYAFEKGGATGSLGAGDRPGDLGTEASYKTGQFYENKDVSWEGMGVGSLSTLAENRHLREFLRYSGGSGNISDIQTRRGIVISKQDLDLPEIPDSEKYPWEASLEGYVGKDRVERLNFH